LLLMIVGANTRSVGGRYEEALQLVGSGYDEQPVYLQLLDKEEAMKKLLWGLLISGLVPLPGSAQTAPDSWDNLKQLQPGQRIEVVDKKMKTLSGAFVSSSDDSISLREGKSEQSVARADVVRVNVRDNSHRTRNVLLGSGILGGIALAVALPLVVQQSNEGNSCGACVAVIAAGFGGGAALGAAIPGSRTVYRAEKQRSKPQP
jgi:hypothetical protein